MTQDINQRLDKMDKRFDEMENRFDEKYSNLDRLIRGDGNGMKGINVRLSNLENDRQNRQKKIENIRDRIIPLVCSIIGGIIALVGSWVIASFAG